MKPHPRDGALSRRLRLERQLGRPVSRREFLRATALGAASVPTMSAILAACSNPRESAVAEFEVATPDNPVTLPLRGEPIPDGLEPEQNATLQIFNWDLYLWPKVIKDFCAEYNCDYEYTPFENMEQAVAKMQTGELKVDVWFPTYDVLGKAVNAGWVRPLNQSYIPNLAANAWDTFQNPFYDQGWQYSVPYTVYTTGISYRRDRISDEELRSAANPRSLLWDPQYTGEIGFYDSYRDTIAFTLQERGINDVNTEDPAQIEIAKNRMLEAIDLVNVRTSINGSYARLPKGNYTMHISWSGDIVAGWGYVPDYTEEEYQTLGYWVPEDRSTAPADNDLLAVGSTGDNPVLAHLFLNWMLDYTQAMTNFSWNGYQPPQKQADPDTLTKEQGAYSVGASSWAAPITYVPAWMPDAVVYEDDLKKGLRIHELSLEGDGLWQSAWEEFKAGTGG